ncbi:MAG: Ni/Fe-hydrogenase, b-type cytochrome subunit [Acidobacteriota bacterium]
MTADVQHIKVEAVPQVKTERTVRYYVWDRIVRLTHWVNLFAVATLIYTGFYIGGPFFRPTVDEPYGAHSMATMKNLHFIAAVVFTMNGLVRFYWFFAGKTYSQWFRLNLWQGDYWREVWWKLKEYLSLRYVDREPHTLGHNALASLSYSLLFLAASFIGVTGFAMAGKINPGGFLDTFFGWVVPLFGSEANVRSIHRLMMWAIIAFMIHHIAFVFYYEIFAEKGLLSSIITGIKIRPASWKPNEKPWKKE